MAACGPSLPCLIESTNSQLIQPSFGLIIDIVNLNYLFSRARAKMPPNPIARKHPHVPQYGHCLDDRDFLCCSVGALLIHAQGITPTAGLPLLHSLQPSRVEAIQLNLKSQGFHSHLVLVHLPDGLAMGARITV